MDDLYHRDLPTRFQATERFVSDEKCLIEARPRGCWGSANAWIILVGPSPGGAKDANSSWHGGPGRPMDKNQARISSKAGTITFQDGKNRNERWMRLIDDFTGDRKYTSALTAVCNLDWGNQKNEALIPQAWLEAGCPVVGEIIQKSKPRVIAAMTVIVWDNLVKYYEAAKREVVVCEGLKRNPVRLRLFEEFDTFLIKVRHPSYPIPKTEREIFRQFASKHVTNPA
jgi:hypothetical protein